MFFVVNKSKIFSYIVALFTVGVLFYAASSFDNTANMEMIETDANIVTSNSVKKETSTNKSEKVTENTNTQTDVNIVNNTVQVEGALVENDKN